MKQATKLHWILTAAVTMTLTGGAFAQYRVGTDGRARDASNRIGSGGYNGGVQGQANVAQGNYLQNNLITGNVTGGKQFRGFVPYESPDAFRGNTAGATSDRFIRQSSAAPYGGIPQNNAQVTQGFVGVSQAAPPPPGYVQQGYTGGAFVPGRNVTSRSSGDLRLGQVLDAPTTALPQPGQFLMPGPVDPGSASNSVITGSPLYGVRQWNPSDFGDQQFLNNNMGRGGTNSLLARDPAALEQMRQQLLSPTAIGKPNTDQNLLNPQNPADPNNPNPNNADPNAPQSGNNQSISGSALTPIESPRNAPLGNSSILQSNQSQSVTAFSGSMQSGGNSRQRSNPAMQSTQYAELQNRLNQLRVVQDNDLTTDNDNQNRRPNTAAKRASQTGTGTAATGHNLPGVFNPPGGAGTLGAGTNTNTNTNVSTPGGAPLDVGVPRTGMAGAAGGTPNQQANQMPAPMPSKPAPTANATRKPAPLQIKSLADGVQASGLAGLLKDAEEQMKQGKYNSALEKYNDADEVAPNNPLILVGKANALLGQSYFARAERNLREAFMKDQALLLGQYDLRSFLSADRLQFLVNELKSLAETEQKEPRHVFLLAYVAYNTGNEAQAAAYLTLAEKRSGGTDPLYPLLRKYWSLPTQNEPTDGLNK